LDEDGLIYYIEEDGDELICATVDAVEVWRYGIPTLGPSAVITVGKKFVYVNVCTTAHRSNLYLYDRQGEIENIEDRTGMYESTFDDIHGSVIAIVEDYPNGIFYMITTRWVCSCGFGGDIIWTDYLWERGYTPHYTGALLMLGHDRRPWVYCPIDFSWRVFNRDGTVYKQGAFDGPIRAACIGVDGRLYLAFKRTVHCYDDWDEHQWSMFVGEYIDDMVMDIDNFIYAVTLYTYRSSLEDGTEINNQKILVLDPEDGSIVTSFSDLGVNTDILNYINEEDRESIDNSYLAIGENRSLAFLHRSGLLQVYNPSLQVWTFIDLEAGS
jgi:hypothetical protein